MKHYSILLSIPIVFIVMSTAARARDQGGPTPEVRRAVSSVVAMIESEGDDALNRFANEALSDAYRKSSLQRLC